MTPRRICILTTLHLTNNPRLVKEAKTLQHFGHEVTIVSCRSNPEIIESDDRIVRRTPWLMRFVCWDRHNNSRLFWWSRLRQFGCRYIVALIRKLGISRSMEWLEIRAFDRVLPEIWREARRVDADLFIGHSPGLLPIVWQVAKDRRSKCGFDVEDFHSGMIRIGEEVSLQDKIIAHWEKKYLNRYDYLTAAAPLIACEYSARHGISIDAVVLNTFDPACQIEPGSFVNVGVLSLYWSSQTIGAHRGLEDVVRALALLKEEPVKLFLRGHWQRGYEAKLRRLADDLGVPNHMIISLPRVAYDDFVVAAAQYDVGLAVEEPTSRNREICVTNKLFAYLSAGLAVAATATVAQAALMERIPETGFLFSSGDYKTLAERLRAWLKNPTLLGEAKVAAFRAAQEQFNWSKEQTKFYDVVKRSLQ